MDAYEDHFKKVAHMYDTTEGELWELIMGRFIHTGGWYSSVDLAGKAGIKPNMNGVDLCSNSGESARFLVRNCGVRKMHCVDISSVAVERGRKRSKEEGFGSDQIVFTEANVCEGLPMFADATFDFVWSDDAWAHVPDKGALIKTAERILKPGGIIAFTDWILGSTPMTKKELDEWSESIQVLNQETVEGYAQKMADAGFTVMHAHDTNRFVPYTKLYIDMLEKQLRGDAMRLLENDYNAYDETIQFFYMMLGLAKQGKIAQGLFVGRKKGVTMHQSKL
eukprot:31764_1